MKVQSSTFNFELGRDDDARRQAHARRFASIKWVRTQTLRPDSVTFENQASRGRRQPKGFSCELAVAE